MNKNVLNYIFKKIKRVTKKIDPCAFSFLSKNVLNFSDKSQGSEVEKYIEEISDFKRTGTDGLSFEKVGHKGDLEVYYNGEHHFPNVKSTMVNGTLWLKTNNAKMSSGAIVKVFDSSRSQNFSLIKKLRQINYNLPIIHLAWDAQHMCGVISVTSLKEMSAYTNTPIYKLFKTNKCGQYNIAGRDIYETALSHKRVYPFGVNTLMRADELYQKYSNKKMPSLVELL